MSDAAIPEAEESARRGPSLAAIVWLVPIAALLITLGLVWQTYSGRGPTVTVAFDEASGVVAGETPLRYRDVTVGMVEEVGFTDGLASVELTVRVTDEVAPYIDEEAVFWIVRPEISARGITGVETVLSGVYIEASWDTEAGGLAERHVGAARAPLALPTQDGLRIRLRSAGGEGLGANTPILYRGLEVGRVAQAEIAEDGTTILAEAIIFAPHDRLVTTGTRFFDTSGFTFRLGPQGAEVDFKSVAALLSGGVGFDTVLAGGDPVRPGTTFELYWDESQARNSVFTDPEDSGNLRLSAVFEGGASGLVVGSAVELGGLVIGEVRDISGIVDPDVFGDSRVRLITTLAISPERLGLAQGSGAEAVVDFLSGRIEAGLRAQLAPASFLTGALKVELVRLPDAPPASMAFEDTPYPQIPTVPAEITDIAATAEAFLQRVSALPLDDLVGSVVGTAEAISRIADAGAEIAEDEALAALPAQALGFVEDLRALAGNEALQAAPGQIGSAAQDLAEAAGALSVLIAQLEEAGFAATLTSTTAEVGEVSAAAAVLAERLSELAGTANELPLPEIADGIRGAVVAAEAVLASEGTQALPGLLAETAGGARDAVVAFRDGGGAEALTRAVGSAADAADAFAVASEGIPELVASLTSLSEEARALPLDRLAADASAAVASLDALLSSEDTRAIPAEARAAIGSLASALSAFDQGGGAEALTGALTAAEAAATGFAQAAEGAPELVAAFTALAETANALPLGETVGAAQSALTSLDTLLSSEATLAIPAEASAALASLRTSLAAFEAGGGAGALTSALASADEAAAALAQAAAGGPELVAAFTDLAQTASALPLEEVVLAAEGALTSLDAILSSEAALAIPEEARGALASLRATLTTFQAGGGASALVGALAAAQGAARSIETAAEGAPAVIAGIDAFVARANGLPIEEIGQGIADVLASTDAILASDGAQAIPARAAEAVEALNLSLAAFADAGGAEALVDALDAGARAADRIGDAATGVPVLVERLSLVAQTVADLPLGSAVEGIEGSARAAERLLGSEATAAIPGAISSALQELRGAIAELRADDGLARLVDAIEQVGGAAAQIGGAAESIGTTADQATGVLDAASAAIEGVPALVERLNALAATANDLPLATLLDEAAAAATAARAILDQDSTRGIPETLNSALTNLALSLEELREGGTVENVNATLAAASAAAERVADASGALPELVTRASATFAQIETVIGAYGEDGRVNRDAREALGQISAAAKAIGDLAEELERNPQSLLTGR